MSHPPFSMPRTTRREFIRRGGFGFGLIAFHQVAPAFLTRALANGTPAPGKDQRILVLVQLAGGNDGLNTVVPFQDDRYYALRPTLGLPGGDLLKLPNGLGLHPECEHLYRLFGEGRLSIVGNVGYPNPNRSHFRSMEIWETAVDSDETSSSGWIGRYFDHACAGAPAEGDPKGVFLTDQTPQVFDNESGLPVYGVSGRRGSEAAGDDELLRALASNFGETGNRHFLSHTLMDALAMDERVERIFSRDRPEASYPGTRISQSLKGVAAMIAARLDTRVYFVSHGGFDTHANQAGNHARLLGELSAALDAFQNDLTRRGLDSQVLTVTFSEFGRRPMENESRGTDHGTAAPLFVMGTGLNESFVGGPPDLGVPRNGDLGYEHDFRQVYATVLEKWLGAPSEPILGGKFDKLGFLA